MLPIKPTTLDNPNTPLPKPRHHPQQPTNNPPTTPIKQQQVNHWLLHHGMSIGIGDTVADDATMVNINAIIEKAKEDVRLVLGGLAGGFWAGVLGCWQGGGLEGRRLGDRRRCPATLRRASCADAKSPLPKTPPLKPPTQPTKTQQVKGIIAASQAGQLEAQPGRTLVETFEAKVNGVLNKARDDAGKTAQNSLNWTNNIVRMVTAGACSCWSRCRRSAGAWFALDWRCCWRARLALAMA